MTENTDIDTDLLESLNLDEGPFYIPPPENPRSSSKSSDSYISNFIKSQHDLILKQEINFAHFRFTPGTNLNLERSIEDLKRFRNLEYCKELESAKLVSSQLVHHFTRVASTSPRGNPVQDLAQSYVNNYDSMKLRNNFELPWNTADDEVQDRCLHLVSNYLKTGESSNDRALCRAYLLGYLECIGRVSCTDMSNQGKIFYKKISHLAGRHPFGTLFNSIIIGLKVVIDLLKAEQIRMDVFVNEIDSITKILTGIWLNR
jgi:hypothetical protein